MAHPDWLGNQPEQPYWSDDGQTVFFWQKVRGSEDQRLVEIDLLGNLIGVVEPGDQGRMDQPNGEYDSDRRRKVYSHQGNLFVKELASGSLRQLTRTSALDRDPFFLADDRQIAFERNGDLIVRELHTGFEYQPFEIRTEDAPEDEPKTDEGSFLEQQQARLFEIIRQQKNREEQGAKRRREAARNDTTRVPPPFYLGEEADLIRTELSPDGRWALVVLAERGKNGKADSMPSFVSASGYVENRDVRSKVGTLERDSHRLVLLDLQSRSHFELDLKVLPGIFEDPFAFLKSEIEKRARDNATPRKVRLSSLLWNQEGTRVVFQAFAADNKDRWIAAVDLETKKILPLERDTDSAWVNWRFSSIQWLPDDPEDILFISERSGYAHLYRRSTLTQGAAQVLTQGDYEISNVVLARDQPFAYMTANREHPGVFELYRLDLSNLELQRITSLGGKNEFVLAPDQKQILIRHSTALKPYELYVQENKAGAPARKLTSTISSAFLELPWESPTYVEIPSRHGRAIHARLYGESSSAGTSKKRPAVLFIHGAGYLQNAHKGWSGYFREFMFHSFLVQQGYLVLDMDYRASAGYGRDWRTAIYRQMGTPELEDMEDGVRWLVQNHQVDPERVGVYGGSYGGFLTLMALFRNPQLFACGAALRPVTDWAHYNHGYTSNILNTPEIDPEAYARSSPIEFAAGLENPLLICHGMLDDNVFFQDTVRLAQRLIELQKEDWEVAIYPIEPHGFREPSSWLDEYRRIYKLFESHLKF